MYYHLHLHPRASYGEFGEYFSPDRRLHDVSYFLPRKAHLCKAQTMHLIFDIENWKRDIWD